MEDVLIPMTVFGSIVLGMWVVYHYKSKDKEKIQETINKAIDSGQSLTPETIKALGGKAHGAAFQDLRKSVILISLGIAMLILAQVIPDDEAPQIVSGLASFPIVLGVGYYLVYCLGKKQSE
ncbi:DUF6249 domain-containing protein [Pseudemcibacter aquimaris]|uniref:DUF6249 domain-containing protein n=1 Tax=Pseudemcibacter aquimaris TaxID=2857064 RepID=UPI00201361E0|nr:DUF6249 domain-containing protein [Pseudemcibacter aquimaris]MCC3861460.1 DUF6249 domain-containing protein [Pseudemcibacter aquimaris]WDU58229.1 hypothetical protein KW060_13640 [Pseudemcibacter aquimaris]